MIVFSLMFGGQNIAPSNQLAWASTTEGILNLATGGLFDLMGGGRITALLGSISAMGAPKETYKEKNFRNAMAQLYQTARDRLTQARQKYPGLSDRELATKVQQETGLTPGWDLPGHGSNFSDQPALAGFFIPGEQWIAKYGLQPGGGPLAELGQLMRQAFLSGDKTALDKYTQEALNYFHYGVAERTPAYPGANFMEVPVGPDTVKRIDLTKPLMGPMWEDPYQTAYREAWKKYEEAQAADLANKGMLFGPYVYTPSGHLSTGSIQGDLEKYGEYSIMRIEGPDTATLVHHYLDPFQGNDPWKMYDIFGNRLVDPANPSTWPNRP
jgi:hypothetical protein